MTKQYPSHFHVEITLPPGMSVQDMKDFIWDALGSWGKSYKPLSPEFSIGDTPIKVTTLVHKHWKDEG